LVTFSLRITSLHAFRASNPLVAALQALFCFSPRLGGELILISVPCVIATLALLSSAPAVWPQDPVPAADQDATNAPTTPTPSKWNRGGIDIYLLGDVFGDINFNHPSSGINQLYNFDDRANQVRLNLAKVSLEKASGVFGFRVDAGAGRALTFISSGDDAPEGFKYLEQMFLEFRPPKTHGLQIDFGKFVTSAGAELIESNTNWNYSRSYLFALGSPYYHFGTRATIPINKKFTAGVQLVNGWNSLGTNNKMQTVGLVGNFTFKKATWSNAYYTGPQQEGSLFAYRQVFDSVLSLTPNEKTNIYFDVNAGTDKNPALTRQNWFGFAAAGRYQLTKRFAIAPRIEVFNDFDGFATGTKQIVTEFTLTGEMKIYDWLVSRLEYRRDMSDQPYFDRGAQVMVAKNQSTIALGLMAFFGPKK
jgi:hypothetical protein